MIRLKGKSFTNMKSLILSCVDLIQLVMASEPCHYLLGTRFEMSETFVQ